MTARSDFLRHFTPWARAALAHAGITERAIADRTPEGCVITGWGKSSGGPFTFLLTHKASGTQVYGIAFRLADVPDAIERLTGGNALEEQLAASLAARGIG